MGYPSPIHIPNRYDFSSNEVNCSSLIPNFKLTPSSLGIYHYEYDENTLFSNIVRYCSMGEILFNFFRQTKKHRTLKSIAKSYLRWKFWLDFLTIFSLESYFVSLIVLKLIRYRQIFRCTTTLINGFKNCIRLIFNFTKSKGTIYVIQLIRRIVKLAILSGLVVLNLSLLVTLFHFEFVNDAYFSSQRTDKTLIYSLQFLMETITTLGYGSLTPHHSINYLFTMIL